MFGQDVNSGLLKVLHLALNITNEKNHEVPNRPLWSHMQFQGVAGMINLYVWAPIRINVNKERTNLNDSDFIRNVREICPTIDTALLFVLAKDLKI